MFWKPPLPRSNSLVSNDTHFPRFTAHRPEIPTAPWRTHDEPNGAAWKYMRCFTAQKTSTFSTTISVDYRRRKKKKKIPAPRLNNARPPMVPWLFPSVRTVRPFVDQLFLPVNPATVVVLIASNNAVDSWFFIAAMWRCVPTFSEEQKGTLTTWVKTKGELSLLRSVGDMFARRVFWFHTHTYTNTNT